MARVTIEDCLKHCENMYELVHVATRRTRQLLRGSEPMVKSKNRAVVTALREIAAGKVRPKHGDAGESSLDDLPLMTN
jgi:DNA-directed RNA polymerase subunit omega